VSGAQLLFRRWTWKDRALLLLSFQVSLAAEFQSTLSLLGRKGTTTGRLRLEQPDVLHARTS